MTAEGREELRAELLSHIPWWYLPWSHLLFPSLVGVGLVVAALRMIRDLRPWQLAFVPVFFLLANAIEWHAHRDMLHKRLGPLAVLYQRHTPQHHAVYVMDDMAMRSTREFKLVLLPAYGVLTIFAATLPVLLVFSAAGQRNLAALWAAVTVGYVLFYEWLHLSYHLPPEGRIGRLWPVRVLRRHHALHHNPALMQRWNFNVTLPVWDWLRGTVYRVQPVAGATARGHA